mmetsp:Transcript_27423/g.107321  ORF Transcript_27423/g.107321 Transcript_27423/m.107321 type:complete len:101 (-) Transcript_27423:2184-2486(-)
MKMKQENTVVTCGKTSAKGMNELGMESFPGKQRLEHSGNQPRKPTIHNDAPLIDWEMAPPTIRSSLEASTALPSETPPATSMITFHGRLLKSSLLSSPDP